MGRVGCEHLAARLGDKHHVLDVEALNAPDVAGHLHGQHHTRLQGPGGGGVDVGGLGGGGAQADAVALVAPADLQCRVVRIGTRYTVNCTPGEKVSGHRPSVDAMFYSMAEVVTCKMVGIIMTGMGQDGAHGLLEMRKKGAYTIGQDKESSVVYGMPGVAQNIGAVMIQASCENIANVLLRQLKTM